MMVEKSLIALYRVSPISFPFMADRDRPRMKASSIISATGCSDCSTRTQTEYWALDTRSTVPSASRWAAYSVCWESVSE